MQSTLAEKGLSASYSASLKLYYTALPLISSFQAQKIIESCIISFSPSTPLYSYRKLYGVMENKKPSIRYQEDSIDYRSIVRRYDYENHFLNMISTGNVEQVSSAFLEMQKSGKESGLGSLYINNPQASTAILRTLVRKAALLLKETALQVQEISNYVGYPDNNYFIKVFKKMYNMTPSEYRKVQS
jgi:transcriptional regulator araC family